MNNQLVYQRHVSPGSVPNADGSQLVAMPQGNAVVGGIVVVQTVDDPIAQTGYVDIATLATVEYVDEQITTIELTPGPQGDPGADGATGAAGPNSVSNATTTTLNGVLSGNGSNVFSSTSLSLSGLTVSGNATVGTLVNSGIKASTNFGIQLLTSTGVIFGLLGTTFSTLATLSLNQQTASNPLLSLKGFASATTSTLELRSSANSLTGGLNANSGTADLTGVSTRSGAADPTTSDILSGYGCRWKNTTSGEIRDWVNDGGTMKKSAAYT